MTISPPVVGSVCSTSPTTCRECLAAVADTSISGSWVVRELGDLIARRGAPKTIVSGNGTVLTSTATLARRGGAGTE